MTSLEKRKISKSELLLFLENNYFINEKNLCPKMQCLKLLQVYFQVYEIPTSQKRLYSMLSSEEGCGVGNIDLNRRCLICAYRGYRNLYKQKYEIYPGNDVDDDFGIKSIPEDDLINIVEKQEMSENSKSNEKRKQMGFIFTKIYQTIFSNNGKIFADLLFSTDNTDNPGKESCYDQFFKIILEKSLNGNFAINIIFVPMDKSMLKLEKDYYEILLGHCIKYIEIKENVSKYISINGKEFVGYCKRDYINIGDEIEKFRIVKIVDVPIIEEMKIMFCKSKRIYSDRVILLFIEGFLLEEGLSTNIAKKIFKDD